MTTWKPTGAEAERLVALATMPQPRWLDPLLYALYVVPPCRPIADRLHHWRTERAVRLYRATQRRKAGR